MSGRKYFRSVSRCDYFASSICTVLRIKSFYRYERATEKTEQELPFMNLNLREAYNVVTRVLFFAAEALRQKRKTSASEKEKTATTEATTTPVKD
jgi:hypothetical protein